MGLTTRVRNGGRRAARWNRTLARGRHLNLRYGMANADVTVGECGVASAAAVLTGDMRVETWVLYPTCALFVLAGSPDAKRKAIA